MIFVIIVSLKLAVASLDGHVSLDSKKWVAKAQMRRRVQMIARENTNLIIRFHLEIVFGLLVRDQRSSASHSPLPTRPGSVLDTHAP